MPMNKEHESADFNMKLIVFVVKKGMGSKVSLEARKYGAMRRVVLLGKGTAPKKIYLDFLGIDYEPEKEIVIMIVEKKCLKDLIAALTKFSHIDQPGQGIAFVIDIAEHSGWLNLLQIASQDVLEGKHGN
jgi:nitrogen regulatory protein P-II 1